jgi:hypothetical protein
MDKDLNDVTSRSSLSPYRGGARTDDQPVINPVTRFEPRPDEIYKPSMDKDLNGVPPRSSLSP